ncbi:MAG: hypothetical protein JXR45_19245 [Deltaproteobacteria bacterium]|nr:hypothetical protein [Deltaproteobacteria bacterium]
MDCSEYNALCTQADVPLPIVISDASPFFLEPQTHGCALQENICDGDTDLHCSSDHSAIAVCSYTDEPAAMVIEGNDGDYPECVETSDGLAAFAFLEGECENYSSICDENNGMYKCESGVWRQYIEDVCDPEEHRICTEETDTDGNPVASCKFKDPCDDETGEYKICASEISNDAVFHCNFSSTSNIWKWSIYLCPKGTICEPYDDSYVSCN